MFVFVSLWVYVWVRKWGHTSQCNACRQNGGSKLQECDQSQERRRCWLHSFFFDFSNLIWFLKEGREMRRKKSAERKKDYLYKSFWLRQMVAKVGCAIQTTSLPTHTHTHTHTETVSCVGTEIRKHLQTLFLHCGWSHAHRRSWAEVKAQSQLPLQGKCVFRVRMCAYGGFFPPSL